MIDNEGLTKKVFMMSNLSFDHPLTNIELLDLQNLLMSGIPLAQIYFKDNIDIDTIEKIKLLLEGLSSIDDRLIEKYIMKEMNDSEKERIINMNFLNIDSWNISYLKNKNKYMVTSLAKYRKIEEWFNNTIYESNNNNLSLLEKLCVMYDKVKLFEYDTNSKYDRIPEIIDERRATSYGYNLLFKELLTLNGIPSCIGRISNEKANNYITLAIINDEKYGVSGIYGFDPSMDTIYKDQYKNNLARKMNYNFFGITVDKLKHLYSKKNMHGFLRIISSDDINEYNHWNYLYQIKNDIDELHDVELEFGISLQNIYNKTINTNEIPNHVMLNIITKSLEKYPSDIIDKTLLTKVISDNYNERNQELFTSKHVKRMYKVDI